MVEDGCALEGIFSTAC